MNSADQIDEQAAEWLIRLDQADVPAQVKAEFDQWRDADPRHEAAFVRLAVGWERSARLKAIRPYDGLINPDILAPPDAEPPRVRWPVSRLVAAAAGIVAVVALGVLIAFWQSTRGWQTYSADSPAIQWIVLSDGSAVFLNADSKVRIRYSSLKREVQLLRGQANFRVAHDVTRPFDVQVGDAVVRAVGTQFTVRRRGANAIDVVVNEGRVLIDSPELRDDPTLPSLSEGPTAPVRRNAPEVRRHTSILKAGEIASLRNAELVVQVADERRLEQENHWLDGRLWFERMTLRDVVKQFNQHNARRIEIEGDDIANLRIGGGFAQDDPESFLAAVTRTLPVRVDESDPKVWRLHAADRRKPQEGMQ